MQVLTINHFKKMINETKNIIETKMDYLNYINVFPVKDSDTGKNLLSTFKFTKEDLNKEQDLKSFLNNLKIILLKGARGNSGVIISQFYKGLCNHLIQYNKIGAVEFAQAIDKGCNAAYTSIKDPVDGTMLTVLKGASNGALKVIKKTDSIKEVLSSSFESAQKHLKETMNKLPVLKEAGVVDAGGLGVVYMLGAWLKGVGIAPKYDSFFEDMKLKKLKNSNVDKTYCVNVLLKNCTHEEELNQILLEAGNCVKTISEDDYLRVHLHTNNSEIVQELCSNFGKVVNIEIDNMEEQYEKAED